MSFAVVEFADSQSKETTNELAVIPLMWLFKNERKCYWPSSTGKQTYQNFVRTLPSYKKHWPTYRIFKIHQKCDDYEKGEEELDDILRERRSESEASGDDVPLLIRKCDDEEESSSIASTEFASFAGFQNVVLDNFSKFWAELNSHTKILMEIQSKFLRDEAASIQNVENAPEFPLKSIEELENFNTRLQQEIFFEFMVKRLTLIGGVGWEQLTRAILRFLMTDDVAILFNWAGHSRPETVTKKSFRVFNKILDLITDAVNRVFSNSNTERKNIPHIIKEWLKHAKTRSNSKKK